MASISSSRSSPRHAVKVSSSDPTGFDLFLQLIYMSAVASAGIARSQLFQLAAKLGRPPAEYFRHIHLLCEKLGYNYPRACNVVGQRVRCEPMKTLLLRFADALSSGHPEISFLTQEAQIHRDAYEKEYERNLAALTKWTDAYGAVVVSTALIIIVNLTSTMIYDLGMAMTSGLVFAAVMAAAGGAWVISRAAPSEPEAAFTTIGPPTQRLCLTLAKAVPVAMVLLLPLLALLGLGLGWILILAGLIMLPLGIVSLRATRDIDAKDKEVGPFLRSYGAVTRSSGTTLAEALNLMDLSSFPNLHADLQSLSWRFKASTSPALCWNKLALETGSKLIRETVRIFHDAIELGGDAEMVGSLCSQFATTEVMLRARRKVIASTFSSLTIVMHVTVSGLMIIILEVIRMFSRLFADATATIQGHGAMQAMQLPMLTFASPLLGTLGTLTNAMVIVLALINAYAIIAADGGHLLKGSLYLSILLFLSGVCFVVAPPLVQGLLKVG